MPYEQIVIWSILGLGFVVVVVSLLRTDPQSAFGGMFAAQGGRDWPTGVQESDAPRFAVSHLDALRPDAGVARSGDDEDEPTPEVIDLGERRLDRGP